MQTPTRPEELITLETNLETTTTNTTFAIAEQLYLESKPLHNGRSLSHIASACLYLAGKQCNDPISPDHIISACPEPLTRKYLLSLTKTITRELNLSINLYNPQPYIAEIAAALNLPEQTTELATHIADKATENGLASGRSPSGIASATIYYAARLTNAKRTQKEISDVAMVSEVTIRNIYHLLSDAFSRELRAKTTGLSN